MNFTVVVSAGHSKTEEGVVFNNVHENVLNMQLRDQLVKQLNALSLATIVVPDDLNLRETIKFIRKCIYDVAIEIHFNAGPGSAAGVEAYHRSGDVYGKQLCTLLCNNLSTTLGQRNRGAKAENQSAHKRLGFVHENPKCILIEAAFVTNPGDISLVFREDNGKTWAQTVAHTIADYLSEELKRKYDRKPTCNCGGGGCEICGG